MRSRVFSYRSKICRRFISDGGAESIAKDSFMIPTATSIDSASSESRVPFDWES